VFFASCCGSVVCSRCCGHMRNSCAVCR
jgi:hypothetical protein